MSNRLPPPIGLTADQFCALTRASYAGGAEMLGDMATQYQSECALFGDAGPGQGLRVARLRAELEAIRSRYFELTGADIETAAADPYDEPDAEAAAAYAECYRQGLF